jgi:hypothetical protein
VSATGKIEFKGIVPVTYHAAFTGANVIATFPEGFKGTYEGQLEIDGNAETRDDHGARSTWSAACTPRTSTSDCSRRIHRGVRSRRRVAVPPQPLPGRGRSWRRETSFSERRGPVEADGSESISAGELARPEVTGHVAWCPGHGVAYRDVDYTIDYGTVESDGPQADEPVSSIFAVDTRSRNTRSPPRSKGPRQVRPTS